MSIHDYIKPNWLKRNIAELIALFLFLFAFYMFKIILLKETKADATTTASIVESIKAMLLIVIGFYYGSSIGSKNKSEQLNKTADEKSGN